MTRYILARLLQSVPVLIAITLLAFLVFYLDPADPVAALTRENPSPEYEEALRERLGLDQPVHVQYFLFLGRLARGDLGTSYRGQEPVEERVVPAVWATLHFTVVAFAFTVLIGVPAGLLSAARPYSLADNMVMAGILVGVSAPEFWVGILLIYVFAYTLGWLPTGGSFTPSSVILPALTLALHYGAIVARVTRTSLLEVLGEDYIRTARAKGLSERLVFGKHALRNAGLPVVTILGLQVASMVGGTILVENVFAWPGVGRLLVNAIAERDAPMVQGCIIMIALLVVLVTLITDLIYVMLDPRIRSA